MARKTDNFQEILLRSDALRRPLDWRYRRALVLSRIAPRNRRPRETDDKLICRYADMMHQIDAHEKYCELEKIRRKFKDLFEVHIAYITLNATELALADAMLLCASSDADVIKSQTGLTEPQQRYYRKMFLDIDDRRYLTSFIASQIMEPGRLRSTAGGPGADSLESPERADKNFIRGTFSSRALRVLRLVGFYSSPVVVELMYSGLIADSVPTGRDSAMRFMNQAYLTNIKRRGFTASYTDGNSPESVDRFMKLAYALATEEREEGQYDIMKNLEIVYRGSGHEVETERLGKIESAKHLTLTAETIPKAEPVHS